MIKPTVHRNGTSREALLDAYCIAGNALRGALETLSDAAPNARDYYPQGDDAWLQARAEHAAREEKLRSVLAELQELAESVA